LIQVVTLRVDTPTPFQFQRYFDMFHLFSQCEWKLSLCGNICSTDTYGHLHLVWNYDRGGFKKHFEIQKQNFDKQVF